MLIPNDSIRKPIVVQLYLHSCQQWPSQLRQKDSSSLQTPGTGGKRYVWWQGAFPRKIISFWRLWNSGVISLGEEKNILSGKLPDWTLNYAPQEVPRVLLSIMYVCLMTQQEENSFLNNKDTRGPSQMCWAVLGEESGPGQLRWPTGLCIGLL